MTPDQKFARYVRLSLGVFAVLFIYFIAADIWLPVTPQARLLHPVAQVTPRISGTVSDIYVKNNQLVVKGQPLLKIDPEPYVLALDKAKLALEGTVSRNLGLNAEIRSLVAEKNAAEARLQLQELLDKRTRALFEKRAISQQERDRIHAEHLRAEASVASISARLEAKRLERGEDGEQNLALKQARNRVASAELNLSYTTVYAEADGLVSNLQVTLGTFAKSGVPLTALVEQNTDLVADFREKSILKVSAGTAAKITFDALPGEVFDASVSALEAGVSEGQISANGLLANTEKSDRWVRDAQRQRVHLELYSQNSRLKRLPSGASATVQLLPVDGLGHWLGSLQIGFISAMHYIY